MPLSVGDITDTVILGKEPKEVYKNVFEDIGHYFTSNAERLSNNAIDEHAGMKIEIDIPINEIVKITIINQEYVTNCTKKSTGIDTIIESFGEKNKETSEDK